jgi:hypothetical protein
MDHSKTASTCFVSKTKSVDAFMKLPVSVTVMGIRNMRTMHWTCMLLIATRRLDQL